MGDFGLGSGLWFTVTGAVLLFLVGAEIPLVLRVWKREAEEEAREARIEMTSAAPNPA